jgi:hypothetical protein
MLRAAQSVDRRGVDASGSGWRHEHRFASPATVRGTGSADDLSDPRARAASAIRCRAVSLPARRRGRQPLPDHGRAGRDLARAGWRTQADRPAAAGRCGRRDVAADRRAARCERGSSGADRDPRARRQDVRGRARRASGRAAQRRPDADRAPEARQRADFAAPRARRGPGAGHGRADRGSRRPGPRSRRIASPMC